MLANLPVLVGPGKKILLDFLALLRCLNYLLIDPTAFYNFKIGGSHQHRMYGLFLAPSFVPDPPPPKPILTVKSYGVVSIIQYPSLIILA